MDAANTLVPLLLVQTGFGETRHAVSAFRMKNGDLPSAPHKSCPIQARPVVRWPSGVAATTCMNCAHVPKPVALAAPGLLKRMISPLRKNPTQRFPSGSSAAELGSCGLLGN